MEVNINGITYESKQEIDACVGCVARYDSQLCSSIVNSDKGCRTIDRVIWIKKEPTEPTETEGVMMQETNEETNEEPKYTVEDVLSACEDFGFYIAEYEVESIKKRLAKQNNPDYQLYLKLKEQFGE